MTSTVKVHLITVRTPPVTLSGELDADGNVHVVITRQTIDELRERARRGAPELAGDTVRGLLERLLRGAP